MISAPAIDTSVTAVTPPADSQGAAPLHAQAAPGETAGAASFPAALQDQQNQGDTAPQAATAPVQKTINLAAKLLANATSRGVPVVIADAAATLSDGAVSLTATDAAAADKPKTGDGLPADGNPLPPAQDLQSLILGLTASPVSAPVVTPAPPAPAIAPPPAAAVAAPPVDQVVVADTDPGTRAGLVASFAANAGPAHPASDAHVADRLAGHPVGTSANHGEVAPPPGVGPDRPGAPSGALPGGASGTRPGEATSARPGEVAGPPPGGTGGEPPGSSSGNPLQMPTPSGSAAPAPLQPIQPALNDVTLLLHNLSAIANPAQGTGASNGPAASQLILPAASDLPALKPLGDPAQWSQSLGDRLLVMADQGMQSATIRLQPEHLGPMEIRIQVEDGNAQVWFSAHHGDTRGALQDAIPRLREMFSDQGMSLLQANVDSGRGSFADRSVPTAPGLFPEAERNAQSSPETKSTPSPRVSAWRILADSGSRVDLLV